MTSQVPTTDPTSTAAWARLDDLAASVGSMTIRSLCEADRDWLRVEAAGVHLDASRQRVDADVVEGLLSLAQACGVERLRDQMFAGVHINTRVGGQSPGTSCCYQRRTLLRPVCCRHGASWAPRATPNVWQGWKTAVR
jgi:hypothetical protein